MKYTFNSILFLSLVLISISSCSDKEELIETITDEKIETSRPNWLIGKWVHEDEDGVLHEDWKENNDSTYSGTSYLIRDNDTIFFENLRIRQIGDSIFYESLSDDKIIPISKVYKGIYDEVASFMVENTLFSFPRTIRYNNLNDTLMIIEVSGEIDGSKEVQPYQMVKKSNEHGN
ncbi:MAG TPA: DUF6265 family protein [Taishania sp.]|nr:DUF6265 family protein [Taishania sp.]